MPTSATGNSNTNTSSDKEMGNTSVAIEMRRVGRTRRGAGGADAAGGAGGAGGAGHGGGGGGGRDDTINNNNSVNSAAKNSIKNTINKRDPSKNNLPSPANQSHTEQSTTCAEESHEEKLQRGQRIADVIGGGEDYLGGGENDYLGGGENDNYREDDEYDGFNHNDGFNDSAYVVEHEVGEDDEDEPEGAVDYGGKATKSGYMQVSSHTVRG
jgi:hypothetical protein